MIVTKSELTIEAPIEYVFDEIIKGLRNFEQQKSSIPMTVKILADAGNLGPGSMIEVTYHKQKNAVVTKVLENIRPYSLVQKIIDDKYTGTNTMSLRETQGRTTIYTVQTYIFLKKRLLYNLLSPFMAHEVIKIKETLNADFANCITPNKTFDCKYRATIFDIPYQFLFVPAWILLSAAFVALVHFFGGWK